MKKFLSKCGYIVYKCSLTEHVEMTGGYGLCDMCNTPNTEMYIVPVLNSAMCPKCYEDWDNRAKYYKEDIHFQTDWVRHFMRMAKAKDIKIDE